MISPLVLANRAKFLLNQNSSVILTAVGVVGTIGTAYLVGRASFKAAETLRLKYENKEIEKGDVDSAIDVIDVDVPSTLDKAKIVWKGYIPAVGVGVLTIGAIVVSHRIDAKRIVALTVASGISERAFKEYKEKVVEKLGERQDTKIRDEIAQNRVNENPPRTSELVLAGDGKVLCMDMLTGRYFMSSAEDLKRAENQINHDLTQFMAASLSEFFERIGLAPTAYSDEVGWNAGKLMELQFSTTMSVDNRPCLAVEYNPHPFPDYRKHDYS